MAVISLTEFSGVAPRHSPYLLPAQQAQVAINCNPQVSLKPLADAVVVQGGLTQAGESTLYKFGGSFGRDDLYWFHWAGKKVDVVKGAVSGDASERTYFVKDGVAYKTNAGLALTGGAGDYPWNAKKLGVPSPNGALNPLLDPSSLGDPDTEQDRVYIYTWVTSWGEESMPSSPSLSILSGVGAVVVLSGFDATPPAEYDVVALRIYCTNTGESGSANYQFVSEQPAGITSYNHAINDVALGELCPSLEWAPVPTLDGLIGMANGMMVGFAGSDVIPLEAYRPFAAPEGYRLATDHKIIGGASFGTSAVLCTEGNPYLLQGNEPSSLALQKIDWPQACLSKRSIAEVGGGVIYASPDGLVLIAPGGGAKNLTEGLFSKTQWTQLAPNTIHGYAVEDRYVGFYDTGTVQGGFMLNLQTAAFVFLDFYATAGFSDLLQDALYLKVGGEIQKFEAGVQEYPYTWRSKVFRIGPAPVVGAVLAESYPVTCKLYLDGVLLHTQTVASSAPFRLPPKRGLNLEVELSGSREIVAVHLATSMQELREVIG